MRPSKRRSSSSSPRAATCLSPAAEIAWDLDQQNNGRTFFENTLKGNYVADGANTYNVNGRLPGGIFAGILSFSFDNGTLFNHIANVNVFADVINPQAGAEAALNYANGAGNAAIQVAGTGGRGSVVMFGFPFETITTAANRAAVIDRVFDFFGLAAFGPDNADFNDERHGRRGRLRGVAQVRRHERGTGERAETPITTAWSTTPTTRFRALSTAHPPPPGSERPHLNVVAAASAVSATTPAQSPRTK